MAAYEATGRVFRKFDTQTKGANGFKVREFVLEITDGRYPELIKFRLTQEKCDLLDQYNEGDSLKVTFDLRGREWDNGREKVYLTSLDVWRMEAPGASASPRAAAGPEASAFPSAAEVPPPMDDDLPF